jgi:hypothetical protein
MARNSWARPIARALEWKPLFTLADVAYKLVAYNRRVISLPKPRGVRCACDPRPNLPYQVAYAVLLSLATPGLLAAVFLAVLGPAKVSYLLGLLDGATAAFIGLCLLVPDAYVIPCVLFALVRFRSRNVLLIYVHLKTAVFKAVSMTLVVLLLIGVVRRCFGGEDLPWSAGVACALSCVYLTFATLERMDYLRGLRLPGITSADP